MVCFDFWTCPQPFHKVLASSKKRGGERGGEDEFGGYIFLSICISMCIYVSMYPAMFSSTFLGDAFDLGIFVAFSNMTDMLLIG